MVLTRSQDVTVNISASVAQPAVTAGPSPSLIQRTLAASRHNVTTIAPLINKRKRRSKTSLPGKRSKPTRSKTYIVDDTSQEQDLNVKRTDSEKNDRDKSSSTLGEQNSAASTTHSSQERSNLVPDQNIPTSQDLQHDLSGGNGFFPSVIIGAKESVGLSKIQRADKEIEQMEQVLRETRERMPELVEACEGQVAKARIKRAALEETEENMRVGAPDAAVPAMKERLSTLQWALNTSKFAPEAENIQAAMSGYESGEIGYNDHYTIIYAGHIVGTAPDYAWFVRNRMSLLDSYARKFGEGWMWYEPPTRIHPESRPRALRGMGLDRNPDWHNLSSYFIQQGYWKREGMVRRLFSRGSAPISSSNDLSTISFRDMIDPNIVYCQNSGPRQSFRHLLDSGATYPSLHTEDLEMLGVDRDGYGAQSACILVTANGKINVRVYELWACVINERGEQLVDENDAVWPGSHKYLGGLCPVTEMTTPLEVDENGMEESVRLSGMMPFLACYIASCPTRSLLWLGEDRNDVLGHYRMPGQKKWCIQLPVMKAGLEAKYYDDPKVTFTHRGGRIIDEDFPNRKHASRFFADKGTPQEKVIDTDPAADQKFRPPASPHMR